MLLTVFSGQAEDHRSNIPVREVTARDCRSESPALMVLAVDLRSESPVLVLVVLAVDLRSENLARLVLAVDDHSESTGRAVATRSESTVRAVANRSDPSQYPYQQKIKCQRLQVIQYLWQCHFIYCSHVVELDGEKPIASLYNMTTAFQFIPQSVLSWISPGWNLSHSRVCVTDTVHNRISFWLQVQAHLWIMHCKYYLQYKNP